MKLFSQPQQSAEKSLKLIRNTGLHHNHQQCVSSAVTNHLDDHVPSVPNAWAQLRLAFPHMGTDEEQLALADLRQGQSVMEVSDAAGTWKILEIEDKHVWLKTMFTFHCLNSPEWFPVTLTCLLASTIKGRLGREASSSSKCFFATGNNSGFEESTTNTSSRALDMYFCQYGRRSSLPPTDSDREASCLIHRASQTFLYHTECNVSVSIKPKCGHEATLRPDATCLQAPQGEKDKKTI